MLSKQLYLAGNQMQRMQTVLKKAEDRLKTKDQEIGRLKRKVCRLFSSLLLNNLKFIQPLYNHLFIFKTHSYENGK